MVLVDIQYHWFFFREAKAIGITQSVSSPKVDKEDAGEVEKENPYLFFGSSSYQFVEISPLHCSQFEISTSFNSVSEIVMLQVSQYSYAYVIFILLKWLFLWANFIFNDI